MHTCARAHTHNTHTHITLTQSLLYIPQSLSLRIPVPREAVPRERDTLSFILASTKRQVVPGLAWLAPPLPLAGLLCLTM